MDTDFDSAIEGPIAESTTLLMRLDTNLVVQELSDAWRGKLNLAADAELTPPLGQLINLERSHTLIPQLVNLIDIGESISGHETELLTPDGFELVSLNAWRTTDPETNLNHILIRAKEKTSATSDSEQLSQLRTQHQLILDSAGEGIWGLDKDGKITFGNKAAVEILGWELDKVLGKSSHEVHHHSHEDGSPYHRSECPIFASLQDGEVHHVDNEVFWHTNGDAIPVEYVSTPILKDGKPNGAVIVFRDNTQRRESELLRQQAYAALEQLQTTYQLILDAAGEGIYGLDKDGLITFSNMASTEILGWKGEDMLGRLSHEVHHHSHADGASYPRDDCPIYASIKDGEVHRVENEVFWHTDGSAVPIEYTSTPILRDGRPDGAVVIFRDISDRKEIEKQRELAHIEISILKEKLELERDYLRDEVNSSGNFNDIIGTSESLKRTLAQVDAVAATPASVLILGESGVGKEMIARALHTQSTRSQEALVKVNCASIPSELFESEFFGHVKGSFTGAHKDRIGRLQLADGGTLFLDEVGEIPLSQQGKLLRALQENEFERVGDDHTVKVDVRVIAATNRDLVAEIKAGRFREDLFYRLSVFPIQVPPLRDRINDIAPLAASFLDRACRELGKEAHSLTKGNIEQLKSHSWPGNIRELKNTIERAVISSNSKKLNLDLAIVTSASVRQDISSEAKAVSTDFLTNIEFKALEKENIYAALRAANWKTWGSGGAAQLLGIKPSTLAYQMKQFGIEKLKVGSN
ncbi:MAG: PAS domain S-box-containing protein [Pseudohongiellaceae bacterium]|jgi:PAS domain S-box-containing protein